MANWQQVTILGGLSVFADCWYSRGDGYSSDDDCGVNELRWIKRRKGKLPIPGNPVSQKVIDRLEKANTYWEVDVFEQWSEAVSHDADSYPDLRSEEVKLDKHFNTL